jgi:hypothetical protein
MSQTLPAPGVRFRSSALLLGLALAAGQLAVAWSLSLVAGSPRGYHAMHHWDSGWYERIVTEGYHSPETITPEDPGTAGFFPGYPAATLLVRTLTGLPAPEALLVTAQLCCWGLWTYLLLLCRHWNLSPRLTVWLVLALLLQPASFFFIAGYSESLFLMATLGFFYWCGRPGPTAAVMAAVHGFVLTGTRLVGLPLVVFPVLRVLLLTPWGQETVRASLRRTVVPLLVSCGALLGALSFFCFCQVRFGQWDEWR